MKIEFEVLDYLPERHLRMKWEDASVITTSLEQGVVTITANTAGLVSLARLILTLAQVEVPAGSHWHLDASNAFEEGSIEIIIAKE